MEDASFLVEALEKREEGFHDLSALAQVVIKRRGERVKVKEVILMEKGAKLRLEALGLFGEPIVYFNSDGDAISLFYPAEGKFFVGNVYSEGLGRWLGVDLRVEEVVALLSGNTTVKNPFTGLEATHYPRLGLYRLLLARSDSISNEFWIDDSNFLPIHHIRRMGGVVVMEAWFASYEGTDSYPLPHEIHIRRPLEEIEISLKYDQIEVNAGLPETAFKLPPPQGVDVIHVD